MKDIKRGEIYYADLSPVVGSEQGGVCPVLILQNDTGNKHSPTTIVAAITGRKTKAALPTHVTFTAEFMKSESIVLLEQIRTIDKSRLDGYIGKLDKRMQSGEFNCTCPAYGFRLVKGEMVIEETEAIIVRRIFNLYLQGLGTQAIANILNDEVVPRRYGHSKWHSATIKYILTNERYMGDVLLQKKFTTETLPYRQVRNKGQMPQYYVENSNPPIVSRETYEAVQELLKSRKPVRNSTRGSYPLTGKLRCPECGRSFRRIVTAGTAYWTCSGRAAGATDCKSRRVREDMVYDTFKTMVLKLKDHQEELLGTLIRQITTMQNRTSMMHDRIREIDREIADLGAKNLVVTRLHTSGILNAADYATQSSEISGRITELRGERKKRLADDEDAEWLDSIKTLDGILADHIPTSEFDQELFDGIVDRITVDDNTRLTIRLMGEIELTENIDEKGRCGSI